ncbi:MAG TPA: CPBP family intramembrane glutamic endopeptidase [Candidatus Acidoferrales bacterium]|nr:CPBP family intramembrane glutamic endopeptidase [Candidatus Acidoferrales bacterium]
MAQFFVTPLAGLSYFLPCPSAKSWVFAVTGFSLSPAAFASGRRLCLLRLFGAAHLANPGENILGILQVVAVGLLLCFTLRRTGNLWFALGFHAAWDWAETFFYGTPDSGVLGVGRYLNTSVQGPNWLTGGSAGPEGSILVFIVFAICALLIHLRFPKVIYPDRPA